MRKRLFTNKKKNRTIDFFEEFLVFYTKIISVELSVKIKQKIEKKCQCIYPTINRTQGKLQTEGKYF